MLPINNIILLDKIIKNKKTNVFVNSESFSFNEEIIEYLYPKFKNNYKIKKKFFYRKKIKNYLKKFLIPNNVFNEKILT